MYMCIYMYMYVYVYVYVYMYVYVYVCVVFLPSCLAVYGGVSLQVYLRLTQRLVEGAMDLSPESYRWGGGGYCIGGVVCR